MHKRHTAVVAGALAALALVPAAASAAGTGKIHPGVQTYTAGSQCTANFIYSDGVGTYIGQAAHCSGTGAATETDGCLAKSLPEGTPVEVGGASRPGTMVYNSWIRMQAARESDPETCAYNDLALVRLDPADVANVDPTMPGFGGPTGTASLGGTGSTVFTFGNSLLRAGISKLGPKQGIVVQRSPGGWSTDVYTVTPGIPGDSGSGFLTATGQAAGVLSTVAALPLPLSNGVGDLPRELSYARSHGYPGVSVVNGTRPFNANLLAAIAAA